MIELSPILEGLIQRTTEGKLKWSRTVPHDRFVTSVDAIAIVIQVDSGDHYSLEILNEDGETVESLNYRDTTGEQDEQLARLYVLARRLALNSDATLQKLAKSLEL